MAEAQAGNAFDLWGLRPQLRGQELFWYCPKLLTISTCSLVTLPELHNNSAFPSLGEFQSQGVFLLVLYISLPKPK